MGIPLSLLMGVNIEFKLNLLSCLLTPRCILGESPLY
jgi:hypothetical protein